MIAVGTVVSILSFPYVMRLVLAGGSGNFHHATDANSTNAENNNKRLETAAEKILDPLQVALESFQ